MARRTPMPYEEVPTDQEIRLIVETIRNAELYTHTIGGEFLRKRDEALILLSAFLGTRPGELLPLKWTDIDFVNKRILINPEHNKQRNSMALNLSQKAEKVLLEYQRDYNRVFHSEWVFPSTHTLEPMTSSAFCKRLAEICKMAGLRRPVWYSRSGQPIYNIKPYSFRKYFGTKVYAVTGSELMTMKALRNTSIDSVKPYTFITDEKVRDSIDNSQSSAIVQ